MILNKFMPRSHFDEENCFVSLKAFKVFSRQNSQICLKSCKQTCYHRSDTLIEDVISVDITGEDDDTDDTLSQDSAQLILLHNARCCLSPNARARWRQDTNVRTRTCSSLEPGPVLMVPCMIHVSVNQRFHNMVIGRTMAPSPSPPHIEDKSFQAEMHCNHIKCDWFIIYSKYFNCKQKAGNLLLFTII